MRAGRYFAAIACLAAIGAARGARAQAARSGAMDDLDRARALDQQGVRAFREGRYNDAIRYFEEALRLGGPSSELWNIAKCQGKLDEPEAASESLERYLARSDLSADDRAGARRELDELAHRRSTVTVASSPTGAFVAIDGRRIGRTPTSTDVAAGEHTVAVQREGYPPHVETVTAHFGRAIIVDARLSGAPASEGSRGAQGEPAPRHWFTASAELAGLFARLGSLGRPLYPAGLVSFGVLPYEGRSWDVVAGVRFMATSVSWLDTVHAPALSCGIGGQEEAAVLAAFADVALAYKPSSRWRLSGDAGIGFAGLTSSNLGGDAFVPSCTASPGIVPAGHVGLEASYRLSAAFRLLVSPLLFEVQPAFGGARTTPIDASGPWLRLGAGLGAAIDF